MRKKHGRYALPLVLERKNQLARMGIWSNNALILTKMKETEGKNNLLLLFLKIIAD